MAGGLEINLAVVGDGRAEAAAIERYVGENLPGLGAGLDDVKRPFAAGFTPFAFGAGIIEHGDVQFGISVKRAGVALLDTDLQFPLDIEDRYRAAKRLPALRRC